MRLALLRDGTHQRHLQSLLPAACSVLFHPWDEIVATLPHITTRVRGYLVPSNFWQREPDLGLQKAQTQIPLKLLLREVQGQYWRDQERPYHTCPQAQVLPSLQRRILVVRKAYLWIRTHKKNAGVLWEWCHWWFYRRIHGDETEWEGDWWGCIPQEDHWYNQLV